jgi:hypothetical protein
MLIELFSHIVALDLGWLFSFIFGHLEWLFVLGCLGYFIYGKSPLIGAVFVAVYLFATFDFAALFGWVFSKANTGWIVWAPMLVFFVLFAYDTFFAQKTWHNAKRGTLAAVSFYLALFIVNVVV